MIFTELFVKKLPWNAQSKRIECPIRKIQTYNLMSHLSADVSKNVLWLRRYLLIGKQKLSALSYKVWSKSFVSPLLRTTQFRVSWFHITAVATYLHTEPSPVFCGRKNLDCLACNPPCHARARPNLFGQCTEALFTGAATPEPAPVGQLPRGI